MANVYDFTVKDRKGNDVKLSETRHISSGTLPSSSLTEKEMWSLVLSRP